jgi:hypothetical protein
MTDFFTPCCKKAKLFAWLILFCCAFNAAADGIQIKEAELVPAEETFQLNADFELNFSHEVENALNKGVPLNFLIEFQLISPRQYWFDDEIASASRQIRLSYHALSRQYLVNIDQHQKSFATLQEAKDEISQLREWAVLEKSQLTKGEHYQAALRFRLDHSRLPKALQVEALGSEKWTLVSERHKWAPNFKLE